VPTLDPTVTFNDINSFDVSAGTDLLRTSGFDIPGLGFADYRLGSTSDPAAPETTYSTNTQNGRPVYFAEASISVTQVGAVGDGSTDDTAAFDAAMAVAALLGKAVYVPATNDFYLLSGEIEVPANIRVHGDGWLSRVKQTEREKNIFTLNDGCIVEGLHLEGDGLQIAVCFAKNVGIYADGVNNIRIENNFIQKCECSNIQIRNCNNVSIRGNVLFGVNWGGESAEFTAAAADVCVYSNIAGARFIDSAGYGIYITARAREVAVLENRIQGSALADIRVLNAANTTDLGWLDIANNWVRRADPNAAMIDIDFEQGTYRSRVRGNMLIGYNISGSSASSNAGIRTTRNVLGFENVFSIEITDNQIESCYFGVVHENYLQPGRHFSDYVVDRNTFKDLHTGVCLASQLADTIVPLEGNIFINVSNKVSGLLLGAPSAGVIARRDGDNIEVYDRITAPATGSPYVAGDRVVNQSGAVGQPKGWTYTTGSTWQSWGNL
jgi:hypothetical protein